MWFYLSNFQLPCEPHDSVIGNTCRTQHVAKISFSSVDFLNPLDGFLPFMITWYVGTDHERKQTLSHENQDQDGPGKID